jgi:hypothetical protein
MVKWVLTVTRVRKGSQEVKVHKECQEDTVPQE